MARQSQMPVQFNRTVRTDEGVLMTSGKAGVVIPVGYIPVLRGDSLSGVASVDLNLAEMPRPLLNAVFANVQAWFVPKSIHPQFPGMDEFYHSYSGEPIKQIGQVDRNPAAFFTMIGSGAVPTVAASDFFKTLGIHVPVNTQLNTDIIDAYNLIYNFRLQAHSTKLGYKSYYAEDSVEALKFGRAFWPSGRFARIVPDYERSIVVGDLDLDVTAGIVPVKGLTRQGTPSGSTIMWSATSELVFFGSSGGNGLQFGTVASGDPNIYAEFAGETVTTSLAEIDKARLTQSFAKLRQSMAGNNTTGYVSDETILAHLMQGLSVPDELYKRPWLLDARRVPFGFAERFATDSANLDQSVTTGRTGVQLSLNVPRQEVGGMVIFTVEVLPERLDERQGDDFVHLVSVEQLPNALRDVQNPEPVDIVSNARIDAKHSVPSGVYGYEPLNDKWNRSFTRLGGVFYQATPGTPVVEQRMAIWQPDVVDPVYTADHWLAPDPFPHYVFADTAAPAFEAVVRHSAKIVGNTQIGDVLAEDNGEYAATEPPAEA